MLALGPSAQILINGGVLRVVVKIQDKEGVIGLSLRRNVVRSKSEEISLQAGEAGDLPVIHLKAGRAGWHVISVVWFC